MRRRVNPPMAQSAILPPMTDAPADAAALLDAALLALERATGPDALESWRVEYLGRSGKVTAVLRGVAQLPAEERRAAGAAANEAKALLERRFADRRAEGAEFAGHRLVGSHFVDHRPDSLCFRAKDSLAAGQRGTTLTREPGTMPNWSASPALISST